MASAFDDLLGNLVNKLKGAGVGSKTAAQKRAEIDYLTPSNIAAQAGQGTVSGPAEFYDMSRRTDYTYKPREYDKTIPMNRGMLSGAGLGLAAPATSYSSTPTSTTDRGSTGRGMYGMGTTLSEGPLPASEINPLFSGSDMDSIIEAGGRATDNSSVFTTTDAQTGKEVVVDGYGNAFFLPPKTTTRPGFEDENGNLNLPGMLSYAFGSDGRGALLDEANPAGVGYARDLEGNPFSFMADGIGNLLSDLDAKADPGNVRDQTVRARRADNARDVAEEKASIEKRLVEQGMDQKTVASPRVQRQIEEEQLKRKQERDLALLRTGNLPGREGVETTLDEDMDLEIQRFANKAPKREEKEQGIFDKLMNLFVSPVYGSDTIEDAETQFDSFGNVVNASTSRFISPAAAQSDQLFSGHLNRLGGDNPESRARLTDLASKVAMIESDGNMGAKNKSSSATGLYQFLVDDSKGQSALQTAVNRTKKYVKADWLDEVARTGKVEDLSAEKQTILFFGDIMEKEGSDQYLKKLLDPNASEEQINDAMMDIYLKLHHTDPDEKTLKRAKKFIK
jgi:hypothetical protein